MTLRADAVLFDKDGTLFDFRATWDAWAGRVLMQLAQGCRDRFDWLTTAIGYDAKLSAFLPDSPAIAGTNRQLASLMCPGLSEWTQESLERFLSEAALSVPLVAAVPLLPLMTRFADAGLPLGVVTNDSESAAQAHLESAGVAQAFAFVAGADSGFGAKPDAGPLLAFSRAVQIAPNRIAMVGDSTHDLLAGRAAGMQTVAVLTGPATQGELLPLADVVLHDIGALPKWLGLPH